jgi:putative ABC transport system permease protein
MKTIFDYARAVTFRNKRRVLVYLFGVILGVGLLSSVLFYVDSSASHMTATSLQGLQVDMQAVADNQSTNLSALRLTMLAQPHVSAAERFDLAGFSGSALVRRNQTTRTAAGALVAIEPQYLQAFSSIRLVQGHFEPGGVLISKDMATNLGAAPGDEITISFPDPVKPWTLKITGIADLTGSDIMFASTDPARRDRPFNPPADVIVVDLDTFDRNLLAVLMASSAGNATQDSVVATNGSAVSQQVHIKIDRTALPLDPGAAQTLSAVIARSAEKQVPGDLHVLNNMEATLGRVASDLLWAQVIFIFLSIPGMILAGYLSRYAAAVLIEAQRTELSLLRARGATPGQIVTIVGTVCLSTAFTGAIIGLAVGLATNVLSGGAEILRPENANLFLISSIVALAAGIVLAVLAFFLPLYKLYQEEISPGRQANLRLGHRALWQRLYFDVVAIVLGLAILVLTQSNGFQPVMGAEGQVTLSLSIYTFLAPMLIWLGTVLLFIRIGDRLLQGGTRLMQRALSRLLGNVGYFSARSISRRSKPLVMPALIIALALSFGICIGVFEQTYQHQQMIDAQLTLGADVVITPSQDMPRNTSFAGQLKSVPGVSDVTPLTKKVAYVGTELQDLFGVDPQTFLNTTDLSDSFFEGGTAHEMMARLETVPNGILISPEMAKDYAITAGDTVRVRLWNERDSQYVVEPFQVIGVVREFSTAPKDAFLVANRSYLDQKTGTDNVSSFLVRTSCPPQDVASTIRALPGVDTGSRVQSIDEVAAQLATSVTSVNLTGLARIEWAYAVIIASLGMAIFLIGLFGERKREYGILQAIGANARQVNAFILVEAGVSGLIGLSTGIVVGIPLAQVYVTIMTSIFDPPPSHMFIPWSGLFTLLGLCVLGLLVSVLVASRYVRQLQPAALLREL